MEEKKKIKNMKRIAVIGSESFLARNFIRYTEQRYGEEERELLLYDRAEKTVNPAHLYHQIDFEDFESVRQIDFKADVLMIFIGKTGTIQGFENYEQFVKVNEIIFLHILRAYVEAMSASLIIYPSSRLLYKSNEEGLVDEKAELEMRSIYAVTKYAAEKYLEIYRNVYGVRFVILRICTPFGTLLEDFGNYGTFEIFEKQAQNEKKIRIFGDGNQRKTFTHMLDVCKAFDLIIEKGVTDWDNYNLGGKEMPLRSIVQNIAKKNHVPIEKVEWPELYYKVDGGTIVFDSSRFDKEFGMEYRDIEGNYI